MNWQRHKRALKETIKDIKTLTKIFLVIALVLGIFSLLIVLSVHYPWIGIPFGFLLGFSNEALSGNWRRKQ